VFVAVLAAAPALLGATSLSA